MSSCRNDKDQSTYRFKTFGDFDQAKVLHVRTDAMPYRRALLHHAAIAVAFQRSQGMLRADVEFRVADFEVGSDFDKRPDIEKWLLNAL